MKPYIVVQGPVATRSGYGNHTRDLVRSLIAMDKYDLRLISLPKIKNMFGHLLLTIQSKLYSLIVTVFLER